VKAPVIPQRVNDAARSRLAFAAILIVSINVIGAIGIRWFEGFSWLDSFYTAVQTVTTVGYGDQAPTTSGGRVFAIVLMVSGAGTVLYALSALAQAVVQSEMVGGLGRRRRFKEMQKLNDHYIVCGAGRVGRRMIQNLQQQGLPHVIIENQESRIAEIATSPLSFIVTGDATSETQLIQAGVKKAKGLASCLPDDASNVYVVLTARGLNPSLHIVARAVEEQAEATLVRAGASRVVAPTIIGSQSMARALLKPAVADFMDSIVAETMDLVFEEIAIGSSGERVGKPIKDVPDLNDSSVILVAIRSASGELEFQPKKERLIRENDLLLVIGKAESVQRLTGNK
jgi:voltage-gated potassium channel